MMKTFNNFNIVVLDKMLEEDGISQTWLNLLATHISGRKELEYILADQKFSNVSFLENDILRFLSIGEIGVLYEYSVTKKDKASRKNNGQFFTPDDIAAFMARKSLRFPQGVWLDPCSGIGNLSWHLVNIQKNKETFLKNNIIMSDKDELALTIARVLFTSHFQKEEHNLYNVIEKNFIVFDFLSAADGGKNKVGIQTSNLSTVPYHDYVIMNPPYLALKYTDSRFETSQSNDLYAYFLENAIKTSKGFISITPQSFTNAQKFRSLRKLLLDTQCRLTIYAFDNVPGNIFYGVKFGSSNTNKTNSIRAAIMVAEPSKVKVHKITSLMRWKTSERKEMLKNLDNFLSEAELTTDYFPKVNKMLLPLYRDLKNTEKKIGDILVSKPTKYPLYVPSIPRYFISALKTPVKRTSQKTLYFANESDQNIAYLLINSSLMYWWWRVRDGGMTLSTETIKSMPIPIMKENKKLISELEKSEISSKIYKMNAGAQQENVKHSLELINKVNKLIAPTYYKQLLATHENSELVQLKNRK